MVLHERNSISASQLEKIMPSKYKGRVEQHVLDRLVNSVDDNGLRIDLVRCLKDFTVLLYRDDLSRVNAEHYIRTTLLFYYKEFYFTNEENSKVNAFKLAYPERYESYLNNELPRKDIHRKIHSVFNSVLMSKLMDVGFKVTNVNIKQKLVNKLYDLAMNGQTERIQLEGANVLLTHLHKEEKELNVNISSNVGENNFLDDLSKHISNLSNKQLEMTNNGNNILDVIQDTTKLGVNNE